jgi:hypothetical protein
MLMPYLDSDALAWVDYDHSTRTLTALFTNGRAYRYTGVPRKRYDDLLAAESGGGFFNTQIKPYFPYAEIRRSVLKLPPRHPLRKRAHPPSHHFSPFKG